MLKLVDYYYIIIINLELSIFIFIIRWVLKLL